MTAPGTLTGGTVMVSAGSIIVTGNGTAFTWVKEVVASLNIDGLSLPIDSVESDTALTLVKPSPVSVVDSDYLLEFSSSASALAASNNEGVLNILNRLSLKGEIHFVEGVPSLGLGDDGDTAIDTQNAQLYLKTAGSWGNPIADLKGDQGDSLELDAVGLAVARSTHDDAAALFTYMAEDTGQIAIKRSATSGDWSAWIDFQGPQGIQGDAGLDGADGADGAPGADGAAWSAGTLPDDLVGSDGDFHLEADGDVFAKVSGAWAATAINLTGPQGPQGNPGQDGSDGLTGPTGPQGRSFDPDAQEPAANRSNYDAEFDGFAFLATDTNQVSWKQSASSGDWSAWVDWGGAGGASGAGSTTPLGMFVAASL